MGLANLGSLNQGSIQRYTQKSETRRTPRRVQAVVPKDRSRILINEATTAEWRASAAAPHSHARERLELLGASEVIRPRDTFGGLTGGGSAAREEPKAMSESAAPAC